MVLSFLSFIVVVLHLRVVEFTAIVVVVICIVTFVVGEVVMHGNIFFCEHVCYQQRIHDVPKMSVYGEGEGARLCKRRVPNSQIFMTVVEHFRCLSTYFYL